MKLAACLLNISEARNKEVVKNIVAAAVNTIEKETPIGATVLNVFADPVYNRSVITISGQLSQLSSAVTAAASAVMTNVDMRHHQGGHPRLGAVDLIPVHPISDMTTLADCDTVVDTVVTNLVTTVPGSSFFMFGTESDRRGLIERRKEFGWFRSSYNTGTAPDVGVFDSRLGLTGAGSSPYMTNFNITINTGDKQVAAKVLRRIRSKTGGYPGVSAMAFDHQDGIEIACNVDMFRLVQGGTNNPYEISPYLCRYDNRYHYTLLKQGRIERIIGEFWRTKFDSIQTEVEAVSGEYDVTIVGDSVIVGYTPEHAYNLTVEALNNGKSSLVTGISSTHM